MLNIDTTIYVDLNLFNYEIIYNSTTNDQNVVPVNIDKKQHYKKMLKQSRKSFLRKNIAITQYAGRKTKNRKSNAQHRNKLT